MTQTPIDTTIMILAAGRGERMRELTRSTPKPLLTVGKHSLIEHHLLNLANQGFHDIVINIAYLAEQIQNKLGNGSRYNVNIRYSNESDSGALETAGGIIKALPLINSDPFIVVNADIWTDFDCRQLMQMMRTNAATLVMYKNPKHNSQGDFAISDQGLLEQIDPNNLAQDINKTFTGIACYRKSVFSNLASGKRKLKPIFDQLLERQLIKAVEHKGTWYDIGTPQRLNFIRSLVGDTPTAY